ncbi:MAG: PorP/SprF family type IX secretion system membrane protein [Bacteroidota bacterium]
MRSLLIISLLFAACASYAQQRPLVTQYNQNNFLLNPALSGQNYGSEFRLGGRGQYNIAIENPAESFYLTGNFSFRKREQSETYGLPIRGKAGEQALKLKKAVRNRDLSFRSHHGVGFVILFDRFAGLGSTTGQLTYAYHYAINADWQISAGTGLGVTQYALNSARLKPENYNDIMLNGNPSVIQPEISGGVWLSGNNFYMGVAGQQLAPSGWNFTDKSVKLNNLIYPHIYATAGYNIAATDEISIVPSVMLRSTQSADPSFDLNAIARYQNNYWIGGSLRFGNSVSIMGGLNILPDLMLGYSYDQNTSGLTMQSFGTHEIVLGYRLKGYMHKSYDQGKFWN